MKPAALGLIGLGTMGRNLGLNAAEHGFPVCAWARKPEQMERFRSEGPDLDLRAAASLPALVAALERPRRILLMVTAGAAVDEVIAQLAPLLEPGDILIDGGNSHFADTRRREAALRARGLEFMGVGISGGEEGARRGPSVMPGGTVEAWQRTRPLFEAIAARSPLGVCVTHVGPDGAGHFVKMVHNGIEYADLQFLAEAYDLMSRGCGMRAGDVAAVFAEWNRGELESFLVELAARVLAVVDGETGRPLVELVLDQAEQKGTGRWTVQAALELGVPVPCITAGVDARALSSRKGERVQAARKLPVDVTGRPPARALFLNALRDALLCARVCAYAQGLDLIGAGSRAYGWNIDTSEMARIWTGGCIIRARLLVPIREAFRRRPDLPHLLLDADIGARAAAAQGGLRAALQAATALGLPAGAMSAALGYFDAYRSERLPLNLTQAMRDAFGSHGYVRADLPARGPQHSSWGPM
ncbi:MAG: NADP-dependent phosphogluconate dehydrogenase [Planctomycetota bacterium]|nr:MAG: NADP-dependent phosphogluconate dehydrogenase [Planctomycetota bacterium]